MIELATTGLKKACRARFLGVVLLALAFVLPGPDAMAVPRDPPPDEPMVQQGTDRPLLARRRRRRYYRKRRPKPRPKARKPAPAPAAEPAPEEPAPAPAGQPTADPVDPGNLRRGGRVEFDGRLVQGQTAKSGAIYLFARKRSQLRSMVQERVDYRKEVLRTVYPEWQGTPKGKAK
jgi:hypothetical protein